MISLVILAIIATYTIPKVLNGQQNNSFNALAKETAGTLTQALQQYQIQHQLSATTSGADLTSYLNYVTINSSGSLIDSYQTAGGIPCSVLNPCLKLHNGAVLYYQATSNFGGTSATNALEFFLDPDGTYSQTTNGAGKSVVLFLYYNGIIRDWGNAFPNTTHGAFIDGAYPTATPPWFSWQ